MLETIIRDVNAVAWGLPMLILLLGTGIYLTLGLGFMTLRKVPRAVSLLFSGVSGRGEGDIVPFKALMTSLSATIGTGNIAGVATAITRTIFCCSRGIIATSLARQTFPSHPEADHVMN